MSEVNVNKITPTTNCGTVTLGDSGDTLSIPSGATLSNAGSITNSGTITNTGTISGGTITGTIENQVSWDTTAKTAGFTAVAGNGYFVNTTSGAITVTLPASPTAGDLVGIKDYANTADTNNITIARNGEPIQGTANDFVISTEGLSIILIYVDGTQGWVSTGAAKASDIAEQQLFVTATGGTVTTCGDYKIDTFTAPGTFCVSCAGNAVGSNSVDYLVIAGGGGSNGGSGNSSGGSGAGGWRASSGTASGCYSAGPAPLVGCVAALPVSVTAYPVTVGAGGSPGDSSGTGNTRGSDSIFSTITSAGGGAGLSTPQLSGGSGAALNWSSTAGGAGNTPPVSPPQGNPGGTGSGQVSGGASGGGGGATAAGSNAPSCYVGGAGGAGAASSITGSPVTKAGGGGGGYGSPGGSPGPGGAGGGGAAGVFNSSNGVSGTANTGGGGGGTSGCNPSTRNGGAGGSGIVIIRYKYQ